MPKNRLATCAIAWAMLLFFAPINVHSTSGANQYGYFNDGDFGSEHPGGAQFLLADGSVHFVSENVDLNILYATASRNGREVETIQD